MDAENTSTENNGLTKKGTEPDLESLVLDERDPSHL